MSEIQLKTKGYTDYVKSVGYIASAAGGIFLAGAIVGPKVLAMFGAPDTISSLSDRVDAMQAAISDKKNWKITSVSFNEATEVIELSRDAQFCALSRVDDDTAKGSCMVFDDRGIWKMQSGGSGGDNACSAVCFTVNIPETAAQQNQ